MSSHVKRKYSMLMRFCCRAFVLLVVLCGVRSVLLSTSFDVRRGSSFECSADDVCTLENVCLNRSNVFQFFLQPGASASQVYERLKNVNLVAAWQLPPQVYHTLLHLQVVPTNESMNVSSIRFFEEPIFLHLLLAVGNFGHTLLQNALPAVLSMSRSTLKHHDSFQTIALNDCKVCGFPDPSQNICMDGIGSYGYVECERMRSSVYEAITGYSVIFSRELFESGVTHLCFRNAVVGFPQQNRFDMLYNPTAEQFGYEKQLIRTRLGVLNSTTIAGITSKSDSNINVGVYCKDIVLNGRHGNTFRSCQDVINIITAMKLEKNVVVRRLNFDGVDFKRQIAELQKIDIYISDGGSSSYYIHLLRAGAVALSLPLCDIVKSKCVCGHIFNNTYANPVVSHISVQPEYIVCHTSSKSNGIFKPLFDVRPEFRKEMSKALTLLH